MGTRFVTALLIAFLLSVSVLGGVGYAISQMVVSTPRDVFRAGFFEFDLAPGWWCEADGTETICTPPGGLPRPAIAIIAMKERNDKDNLDAYEEHLRQPQKANRTEGSEDKFSEVRYVRRRTIGSHEWVEALHAGSEIRNYSTYYLGTTTSFLGILVTMSVHEQQADKYVGQFVGMLETLVVYQR